MPSAHGLFHKVGIQSGPMLRGIPKDIATDQALKVLADLGLARRQVHNLATVPTEQLLATQQAGAKSPTPIGVAALRSRYPAPWGPVVDGTYLPQNPFDPAAPALSAQVPLLIGCMRDEAVFFERENPAFFHADEAAVNARERPVWAMRPGASSRSIARPCRGVRPSSVPLPSKRPWTGVPIR